MPTVRITTKDGRTLRVRFKAPPTPADIDAAVAQLSAPAGEVPPMDPMSVPSGRAAVEKARSAPAPIAAPAPVVFDARQMIMQGLQPRPRPAAKPTAQVRRPSPRPAPPVFDPEARIRAGVARERDAQERFSAVHTGQNVQRAGLPDGKTKTVSGILAEQAVIPGRVAKEQKRTDALRRQTRIEAQKREGVARADALNLDDPEAAMVNRTAAEMAQPRLGGGRSAAAGLEMLGSGVGRVVGGTINAATDAALAAGGFDLPRAVLGKAAGGAITGINRMAESGDGGARVLGNLLNLASYIPVAGGVSPASVLEIMAAGDPDISRGDRARKAFNAAADISLNRIDGVPSPTRPTVRGEVFDRVRGGALNAGRGGAEADAVAGLADLGYQAAGRRQAEGAARSMGRANAPTAEEATANLADRFLPEMLGGQTIPMGDGRLARGAFDRRVGQNPLLRLGTDADGTTLGHEVAHNLRMLDQFTRGALDDYYNAGGRQWTREAEEAFARDLEGYLTNGRAPRGAGLDEAFDALRRTNNAEQGFASENRLDMARYLGGGDARIRRPELLQGMDVQPDLRRTPEVAGPVLQPERPASPAMTMRMPGQAEWEGKTLYQGPDFRGEWRTTGPEGEDWLDIDGLETEFLRGAESLKSRISAMGLDDYDANRIVERDHPASAWMPDNPYGPESYDEAFQQYERFVLDKANKRRVQNALEEAGWEMQGASNLSDSTYWRRAGSDVEMRVSDHDLPDKYAANATGPRRDLRVDTDEFSPARSMEEIRSAVARRTPESAGGGPAGRVPGDSPPNGGDAGGGSLNQGPRRPKPELARSGEGQHLVAVETRPSYDLLPDLANQPDSVQTSLRDRVMAAVFPGGKNPYYERQGIEHRVGAGAGTYEGVLSPNYIAAVRGGSEPKANLVAALEGMLNVQDAVPAIKLDKSAQAGAAVARFLPGEIPPDQWPALGQFLADNRLSMTVASDGSVIVGNFNSIPEFDDIIKGAESQYGTRSERARSAGTYLERAKPEGAAPDQYEAGFGSYSGALAAGRDSGELPRRPELWNLAVESLIEPRRDAYRQIALEAGVDPRPIDEAIERAKREVREILFQSPSDKPRLSDTGTGMPGVRNLDVATRTEAADVARGAGIRRGAPMTVREFQQEVEDRFGSLPPEVVSEMAAKAQRDPQETFRALGMIDELGARRREAEAALESVDPADASAIAEARQRVADALRLEEDAIRAGVAGSSEMGRGLRMLRDIRTGRLSVLTEASAIQRDLGRDLTSEELRGLREAVDAVNASPADQDAIARLVLTRQNLSRAPWWEGLLQARKLGLLTNLRTAQRNFLGNALQAARMSGLRPVDAVGDTLLNLLSPNKVGRTVDAGVDVRRSLKAAQTALADTKGDLRMIRATGQAGNSLEKLDTPIRRTGIGWLDAYNGALGKLQSVQDRPWYNRAYRASLLEQARLEARRAGATVVDLLAAPTEAMLAQAAIDADIATFSQRNRITGAMQSVAAQYDSARVLLDILLPFRTVPVNIGADVLTSNPVGMLGNLYKYEKQIAAALKRGDLDAARQLRRREAQLMTNGAIGSALIWHGYNLAAQGRLSGAAPDEPGVREVRAAAGVVPGSLEVGTDRKSLLGMHPALNLMVFGASMYDGVQRNLRVNERSAQTAAREGADPADSEVKGPLSVAAGAMGDMMMEQPMYTGIRQATDTSETGLERFAGQTLGSAVPTFATDLGQMVFPDEVMREAKGVLGPVTQRVNPRALPEKLDVFGRTMNRPTGAAAQDILRSQPVPDRVEAELVRLGVGTTKPKPKPGEPDPPNERIRALGGAALDAVTRIITEDRPYRFPRGVQASTLDAWRQAGFKRGEPYSRQPDAVKRLILSATIRRARTRAASELDRTKP